MQAESIKSIIQRIGKTRVRIRNIHSLHDLLIISCEGCSDWFFAFNLDTRMTMQLNGNSKNFCLLSRKEEVDFLNETHSDRLINVLRKHYD